MTIRMTIRMTMRMTMRMTIVYRNKHNHNYGYYLEDIIFSHFPFVFIIQSKLDNSTLTGRSFDVELVSMLSYRMYKLMTLLMFCSHKCIQNSTRMII